MGYDKRALLWRAQMDVEMQHILDFLAPYSNDLTNDVIDAAIDYYPANSLYHLTNAASSYGVTIPRPLLDDAESLVEQDGYIEDWQRASIELYKQQHYAVHNFHPYGGHRPTHSDNNHTRADRG